MILPPIDKYIFFQEDNFYLNLSITWSQIDFDLGLASIGNQRNKGDPPGPTLDNIYQSVRGVLWTANSHQHALGNVYLQTWNQLETPKILQRVITFFFLVELKRTVKSANWRCVINSLLRQISKPPIIPKSLAFIKSELNTSTTIIKGNEDSGSPCRIPLVGLNNLVRESLIKTEKEVVEMHSCIHPRQIF